MIEVRQRLIRPGASPGSVAIERRDRGEAVAVDLPGGRTLFALLRGDNDVDWASNIVARLQLSIQAEPAEDQLDNIRSLDGEIEIPRSRRAVGGKIVSGYPILVTFRDFGDPSSVQKIEPENLEAAFGRGVRLKRIFVQITDQPVTIEIKDRLSWFRDRARLGGYLIPMIKNQRGRYEAAPGYEESLVDLGLSDFSTEAYEQ